MTMRRSAFCAGLAGAALGLVTAVPRAGVSSSGGEGRLLLRPCHLDGLAEEVRCGVLEVPEDRDAAVVGASIPIHVAVLPALRRNPEPDPLVILAGGPGQGARSYAAAEPHFRQVRRARDILLVDLRGTGASNPLECGASAGIDELDFAQAFGPPLAARCLETLPADPRFYTHANALADLDDVRRRLGYARVNLWAGSWGTRAALLYAARYPDAVRAIVLDGAVPLDVDFPGEFAPQGQRALDLLLADCAADAACAARFPRPRALVEAVLAAAPGPREMRHPRTGAAARVAVARDTLADILRVALYTPGDSALVLAGFERAAAGDLGPLWALSLRSQSWSTDTMALGATLAVLCSEDVPRSPTDPGLAAGTFLGSGLAERWRGWCADWPRGPGLGVDEAVALEAPALILSGALDPVTPPATGERMARHFPDSLHVVVPGAAHNTSFTGCVPDLIARFVAAGHWRELDASCVERVRRAPFVVSHAGGRP